MVGNVCSSNSIFSDKNVEITSLPALYKSDSGLQQRVWINIVHEGDVEPIVLQLGEVTKR